MGAQPNNNATIWGTVQRLLNGAVRLGETTYQQLRMGPYGEPIIEVLTGKQHKLSDEGSYFVCRSATPGTGLPIAVGTTAYSDTKPFIMISNNNPLSPTGNARNIYLDYIKLGLTVTGTSSTSLQYATRLDSTMRYVSGGSGGANTSVALTPLLGPYCTNMASPNNSSALIYMGDLLAVAQSSVARTVSNGFLRTAIPVVNDQYFFNFGGIDMAIDGVLVSGAAIAQRSIGHPPVCIPPQGSFLMHLWLPSMASTPAQFECELGIVER